MTKFERFLARLIIIFALEFIIYVIRPEDPRPISNKPTQTVNVKFLQNRAMRISLGTDAEMRLAVFAGGPRRSPIPVVCPRNFNADPGKEYVADGYELVNEEGHITPTVWILHGNPGIQLIERIPDVGQFKTQK